MDDSDSKCGRSEKVKNFYINLLKFKFFIKLNLKNSLFHLNFDDLLFRTKISPLYHGFTSQAYDPVAEKTAPVNKDKYNGRIYIIIIPWVITPVKADDSSRNTFSLKIIFNHIRLSKIIF